MTAQEKVQMQTDMGQLVPKKNERVCEIPLESKHKQIVDWFHGVRHPWASPPVRCPRDVLPSTPMKEEFQFELPIIDLASFSDGQLQKLGKCTGIALKAPAFYYNLYAALNVADAYRTPFMPCPTISYYNTTTTAPNFTLAGSSWQPTTTPPLATSFFNNPVASDSPTLQAFPQFFCALRSLSSAAKSESRLLRTVGLGCRFTLTGPADTRSGRLTTVEVNGHNFKPELMGTTLFQFHEQTALGSAGNGARFPGTRVYSLSGSPNQFHLIWHPQTKADFQWKSDLNYLLSSGSFGNEDLSQAGNNNTLLQNLDCFALFSQLGPGERVVCQLTHLYEYADAFVPGTGMAHEHEQTLACGARGQLSYDNGSASHVGHYGAHDTGSVVARSVM